MFIPVHQQIWHDRFSPTPLSNSSGKLIHNLKSCRLRKNFSFPHSELSLQASEHIQSSNTFSMHASVEDTLDEFSSKRHMELRRKSTEARVKRPGL